ncbi:LPXTG cell wall anchor domain-containing protein [Micromonospora sp. NPDC003944]
MNPPKSPFRRVAAIAAGALIGLAGVGTFAAPASAHHPEPSGTYCLTADGQVKVTWTVGNSENIDATITKLESTVPGDFTGGLEKDAKLPAKGQGTLTGTQAHRFDQKRPTIELTVEARWVRSDRILKEERTVAATPVGACAAEASPSPSPSVSTPPSSPPASPTPTPSSASPSPSQPPAESPSPTPTATPAPAEPVGSVESTCDKLTFTIENPADGETVTLTLTPNKGEAKTLVVKPGETGSVSFDAFKGLVVTPAAEGLDDTTPIAWEQPADCDKDEPALPLTGAATGGIIVGAVALLAAGAALFVVARRRRVRFTA